MISKHKLAALLVIAAIPAAGCGGGSEATGPEKAVKIDPAAAKTAKGTVTWCAGKDTSGAYRKSIKAFEAAQDRVKVKLFELPESADEQRTQQIQRLRAKSSECDLLLMDVVWTAEYASQGWLRDLTPAIDRRRGEFIPSTLASARFEGKSWGMPYATSAGFVYYRTDQAAGRPTSWEELYKDAASTEGFVYQGADYEGLTVSFLELLYSANGRVLSDDGKRVEVDSPAGRDALRFMVDGYRDGAVPRATTTYKEEEARRAFEAGKATYMRNWPYAYPLGQKTSIKGKFAVTQFPGYKGGRPAGVLGGFNLGISAYSRHADAALAFADFLTGAKAQRYQAEAGTPPVTKAGFRDPAVRNVLPLPDEQRKAVEQAEPRPVSPVYPQITQAIHENVHEALLGQTSPDAALKKMKAQIEEAQKTF